MRVRLQKTIWLRNATVAIQALALDFMCANAYSIGTWQVLGDFVSFRWLLAITKSSVHLSTHQR